MTSSSTLTPVADCRPRRRLGSRWWLAGLLVSCLLPAALAQGEPLRLTERLSQQCLMVSGAIRAHSRRVGQRTLSRFLGRRRKRGCPGLPGSLRTASLRPCADHDVLSRRGPPGCFR
ncbi:hypothetical protein SAMN02745148_02782 [Modicisalibacter ilicicola DSM 19980]|uniref:Uncharacterized protein n=1 Tax=Modicisalibacter ilicicola DSM 19980 TaxID=1121942 RepID=A0A1M5C569_9GAMM|nr:hypothetical protein [Halomonas ilicicola]SHF49855.1 hypothetical protein SAMN02745148_02782 [Halomonas ilicicola DSM 19980]